MPAASIARCQARGEQAVAFAAHPHVGAGREHGIQMRRHRHQRIAAATGAAADRGDVAHLVGGDVMQPMGLGHGAPKPAARGLLERWGRGLGQRDDVGDGAVVLRFQRGGGATEGVAVNDRLHRRLGIQLCHRRVPPSAS
jgi:hypothetical protein